MLVLIGGLARIPLLALAGSSGAASTNRPRRRRSDLDEDQAMALAREELKAARTARRAVG